MTSSVSFAAAVWRICAPLVVWAVHFLVIYAFTAVACARGLGSASALGIGLVPGTIGIATVAAVAAASMTTRAALRKRPRAADETAAFVYWVSAAAGGLAVLAILWQALPALLVPVCAA